MRKRGRRAGKRAKLFFERKEAHEQKSDIETGTNKETEEGLCARKNENDRDAQGERTTIITRHDKHWQ